MLGRIHTNEKSRNGKAALMGIGGATLLTTGAGAMAEGGTLVYRSGPRMHLPAITLSGRQ